MKKKKMFIIHFVEEGGMVSALDFQSADQRVSVFEYLHYCIVSLDKKLWSTLSLFAQPYKWVLEINSFTAGGIPEMDKHSIQERVVILLVT